MAAITCHERGGGDVAAPRRTTKDRSLAAGIHIGVDVGGTFTDIAISVPATDRMIHFKLPSTPDSPDRAIAQGVALALAEGGLEPGAVVRFSHGTTVGTNALIQRRTGRVAMVTTEGFRDLLEIGRQVRPRMYDIHLDAPEPLVPRHLRFEVRERRRADGRVHQPLDEAGVGRLAAELERAEVDCVVVCFLNAYAWPEHEVRAARILRKALPASIQVLVSTAVYPEFREYERFSTAVLNGALLTVMNAYLDRLTQGIRAVGVTAQPKVSQSAGGLMSVEAARLLPIRASLSGPAAGVQGAAYRAEITGHRDLITLDVGGTSADVSLLRGGRPSVVHDHEIAGLPLRLPAIDVVAVGAGGGSIAWIDTDDLLKVGPLSAGAVPGPACYGLGGRAATVTDANVVLGRLNGEQLLDGRMAIRRDLAEAAVATLAERLGLTVVETALGIVRVSAATVVKAIRRVSVERGHDPADFALYAFGGAGPLFAVEVARDLGIGRILVPPHPGILCAEGLLNCDLVSDFVRTVQVPGQGETVTHLNALRHALQHEVAAWFAAELLPEAARAVAWAVDMRYRGQNFEIRVASLDAPFDPARCQALIGDFHRAHEQVYGFAAKDQVVEFVNLGVRAIGRLEKPPLPKLGQRAPGRPVATREVVFDSELTLATPVYRRDHLAAEQAIAAPAVIEQLDSTTIVFPGDRCTVDAWGNLLLTLAEEPG
ncbi:MAG: hydantoinase/oxoprolinase family protein [Alphaproteobacteria bacterium]|nr:hydantoinase/oxoprolinase family protein [Alphaproteobacteria bacterium]